MLKKNLFAQILFITATLILLVSVIQGSTLYLFAKKEMVESGKLDIMHITEAAVPLLNSLNEQVEAGNLSLDEAKEKARIMMLGPKVEGNDKLFYDFSNSSFKYKETGYIFAYNPDNTVALHPALPLGKDMSDVKSTNGDPLIQSLIESSKNTEVQDRYYEFEFPKPGETNPSKKIAYSTYYEPWDWVLTTGAYEDEFYESVNTIGFLTIVIVVIALIVSIIGIFLLLRKKLTALKLITIETAKISNGNLAVAEINFKSEDEIGNLATAFNKMTNQLRGLVQNIQQVSQNTSQASLELSALSEETTASSEEVVKAMDEITKGAVEQSTDIESINSGAEALVNTMQDLSNQNQSIIQLTEVSKHAVTNGQKQISSLQEANKNSKMALINVETTVQQLNGRVTEIAGIVKTIEQLAGQTNLLALNASIEAARAGEHGKGFAVVAGEVRKLAEETNKATTQIHTMITAIEDHTSTSVAEMAHTMDYSQQLDQAVTDTESEFSTISSTIQDILRYVGKSSEYIQSVDESTKELLTSIQSVSSVSEETSATSEEVLASVDQQAGAIRSISEQAESLNQLSDELNDLLKRFTI
ncbi:methyl-accepting chemotaxis protein [Bacillus sp. AK128]